MNKFLDILEIKEKMPPHLIPLILNGWFASDLEKRKRILVQIDYASKNKECLEKLEKEGFIQVEYGPGKAPLVRLLLDISDE